MTAANLFKLSVLVLVAFVALCYLTHVSETAQWIIGIVMGMMVGFSGMAAHAERNYRIQREQWNRRWR